MRPLRLLPLLLLAACTPTSSTPKLTGGTGTGMDMFAPTALRIHPLTRFLFPPPPATSPSVALAAPPTPTLEARFEFSDQFGDPTKSPATISLVLYDQPNPLIHKGTRLAAWSLSLDTPQSNRDHWDRTTRTYLFKLPLPPPASPLPPRDHLLLEATATLPNATTLSDEMEIPLK